MPGVTFGIASAPVFFTHDWDALWDTDFANDDLNRSASGHRVTDRQTIGNLRTDTSGDLPEGVPVRGMHVSPVDCQEAIQDVFILQKNRSLVATLKAGEKVIGLTGVLISRKPDRFLVKRPIPRFSLTVGDVILQYAEWGEGAADLWAKGVWYKSFDWGETEDGNLILSDDNVTIVEHGSREWWIQVKTASGKTGWVLATGNFDGMDALAETPGENHSG
jgi:hypothetical protein